MTAPEYTAPQTVPPPCSLPALREYLAQNGANGLSYGIGEPVDEGFVLRAETGGTAWIYTERGVERVVERFVSEAEAVEAAYHHIRHDPWAWAHVVCFTLNRREAETCRSILAAADVPCHSDQIPYGGPNDPRYRVFVFGAVGRKAAQGLGYPPLRH